MKKKLIFLLLLPLFILGERALAQNRTTLATNTSLMTYTKAAIISKVYAPLTAADISKAVIPKGFTATTYLAKLNELEKALNKNGYSVKDNAKNLLLARVNNKKVMTSALSAINSTATVAYPTDAILQAKASAIAPATSMLSDGTSTTTSGTCNSFADDIVISEPREANYLYQPVSIGFGDSSTLFAGAFAKYELKAYSEHLSGVCYNNATLPVVTEKIKATNSKFSAYIGAEAYALILGEKISLAEASILLNAPSNASQKLEKKIVLKTIAKTIVDEDSLYEGDSKILDINDKHELLYKMPDIVIPIAGPISLKATFSISGSYGIKYFCQLNRTGVYASVTPYAESHAVLEAAVNLGGVASIGVGGELSFFNAKIAAAANASLGWNSSGWLLTNNTDVTMDMNLLKGRLYGFASVDLWFWSDSWEVDFANFPGYTYTKTLIKKNRSIAFPNWRRGLSLKAL